MLILRRCVLVGALVGSFTFAANAQDSDKPSTVGNVDGFVGAAKGLEAPQIRNSSWVGVRSGFGSFEARCMARCSKVLPVPPLLRRRFQLMPSFLRPYCVNREKITPL